MLVVLPTWVGDFVMATPLLRALRDRAESARIDYLIEPNLRDLVRGCSWMDGCIEWPDAAHRKPWHRAYRQLVASLRRRRYDWAVLLPNSARAGLIAFSIRAKRRIGYNRGGRAFLLTDRLPVKNYKNGRFVPLPLVEYYADLGEAIGCRRPDDRLELFTTPDCETSVERRLSSSGLGERRPLVVLSPGAKYGAAKCWAPERFAATADRLIADQGAAVVITCGPGEEEIVRAIQDGMREVGHAMTDPLLTLGELKSLIRRSDLLICNDAGPRHFAKAFDVPVVTIFGPTHPEWTATSYTDERIVRIDVDCGPCQQRICPEGHLDCMTGVTVDMVVGAATGLLSARAAAARTGR